VESETDSIPHLQYWRTNTAVHVSLPVTVSTHVRQRHLSLISPYVRMHMFRGWKCTVYKPLTSKNSVRVSYTTMKPHLCHII